MLTQGSVDRAEGNATRRAVSRKQTASFADASQEVGRSVLEKSSPL